MTTTRTPPSTPPTVAEIAANPAELPTLDALVVEILRVADDPRMGIPEIMKLVSRDVGLTARVMSVANSAIYGLSGTVSTLSRAGMLLGARTIRAIVLGSSLVGGSKFDNGPIPARHLWSRSVVGAVVARELARVVQNVDADECFIAGMLGHVGKLAMADTPGFPEAVEAGGGWPSPDDELAHCGVWSDDVTAAVLAGWNLPVALTESVSWRHRPVTAADDVGALPRIGRVADDVAAAMIGSGADARIALNESYASASRMLGLTPDQIDDIVGAATGGAAEALMAFDLDPLDEDEIEAMLARSRAALIDDSIHLGDQLANDAQRILELEEENERLALLSSIDALTGLANRRTFDDYLSHAWEAGAGRGQLSSVGMLMCDIDHFKLVNDQHGHNVGDQVLAEVARRLSTATRQGDLCARTGGEEFAVVAVDRKLSELIRIAERVRGIVEEEGVETEVGIIDVTVSVGVASISDLHSKCSTDLMRRSDMAMYEAKEGGRNQVSVWGQTDA